MATTATIVTADIAARIRTRREDMSLVWRKGSGQGLGKQLARVHEIERVERLLDCAHDVDGLATVFRLEKPHLSQADPVLAAARAVERERTLHEPVGEPLRLGNLFGRLRVHRKDHVEVAIADVTDERASQRRRGEV